MQEIDLKDKVQELIRDHEVLLFMKGTPEQPQCGFSMRVVGVLDSMGVEYAALDVLPALQPLREVTDELSDWQTFPQLYVKGELVGGCDIVEEMAESGELAELLGAEQPRDAPRPRRSRAQRTRSRARRSRSRRGWRRLDGRGLLGGVFLHLEGGAAAAGGDDVRVVDRKPAPWRPSTQSTSEPKTNCIEVLSTTTETPWASKTWSSAFGVSNASAYWKPEQPPPRTATRRACSAPFSCAPRSSLTLAAALSESLTVSGVSIPSIV